MPIDLVIDERDSATTGKSSPLGSIQGDITPGATEAHSTNEQVKLSPSKLNLICEMLPSYKL